MIGDASDGNKGNDAETAGANGVHTRARAYVAAGLSIIPIRRDGSKAPDVRSWKDFQARRPTEAEVRRWFDRADPPGVAVLGGAVSGGLECIDFDVQAESIYPQWLELVDAEAPGLACRLCVVRTPRPGYHVRYRCTEATIPGNTKLAIDPSLPSAERCLIETRGEGGYAIVPGGPPECHPSGRLYEHFAGPRLVEVQTITAAERETLLRCARPFDRAAAEEKEPARADGAELRPGDDFNRRGPDWSEILSGWTEEQKFPDGKRYWRRPGKEKGWSATTGVCTSKGGVELFACFSENAEPFQGSNAGRPCTCYSRFAAYALLHHGGDYKAAAKELGRQGYGDQTHKGNGHAKSAGENTRQQTPKAGAFGLGPLTLKPGAARRTAGGNVRVQVGAYLMGAVVHDFVLTPSPNAWRQHAAILESLADGLPGRDEVLKVFARIVAEAGKRADAPPSADGPTVESVVKALAAPRWQLTARTAKGAAWSEARGCEVSRSDFIACVDDELMAACGKAGDAPKDIAMRPCRIDLLRMIQAELQVQWATLMRSLPALADADMGRESAAGLAFREAMVRLWTATRTFEVAKTMAGTAGEAVASRASLISRVRSQAKDYLDGNVSPQAREKWRPVQTAFDAWWRPYVVPGDGDISVLLAMRWPLAGQIGVELPGVSDQPTLTSRGTRSGCIDPNPPVTGVLTGGTTRLAVLSLSLAGELLETPQDEAQENQDSDPVTPGGVTEEGNKAQ